MNTIVSPALAPAAMRGLREHAIQSLAFEVLGLAIVSLPFACFRPLPSSPHRRSDS
jgi:hypothetical protein